MSSRPELILIAARARNGVIGRENTLPWRLRADLAHFKRETQGYPILMGRKTWESLGRPLPGRRNLVVSRQADYCAQGAEVFADPASALAVCAGAARVFVIGGAQIYAELLEQADTLLLTEVEAEIAGDAHFPAVPAGLFVEVARRTHPADDDNEFAMAFVTYRRVATSS